jgi:hypothetical protein
MVLPSPIRFPGHAHSCVGLPGCVTTLKLTQKAESKHPPKLVLHSSISLGRQLGVIVHPNSAGGCSTVSQSHTGSCENGSMSFSQHLVVLPTSPAQYHLISFSNWQSVLHPSELYGFPSSHCSNSSRTPSMQLECTSATHMTQKSPTVRSLMLIPLLQLVNILQLLQL